MIKNIEYEIRRNKRAKNIKLSIYPIGRIIVSAPTIVPKFIIDTFVNSKKDWIIKQLDKIGKNQSKDLRKFSKKNFIRNKEKVLELTKSKLVEFNKYYKFNYNKVTVRDQKTRWGSCSSKGNLNFNYKILFLKEELQDYIIVHELCHLKEMNHSSRFWSLVAKTLPNYKLLRQELRDQEIRLR